MADPSRLRVLVVESDDGAEARLQDSLARAWPEGVEITRAASHEAGRIALQVEPFD